MDPRRDTGRKGGPTPVSLKPCAGHGATVFCVPCHVPLQRPFISAHILFCGEWPNVFQEMQVESFVLQLHTLWSAVFMLLLISGNRWRIHVMFTPCQVALKGNLAVTYHILSGGFKTHVVVLFVIAATTNVSRQEIAWLLGRSMKRLLDLRTHRLNGSRALGPCNTELGCPCGPRVYNNDKS